MWNSFICIFVLFLSQTLRYFKGENDRVKYFVLMSSSDEIEDEEDVQMVRACAGALAIMSYKDKEICGKITTVSITV